MSDLISRQGAIMHFAKASKNYECGMFDLAEVTHELWEIPSVEHHKLNIAEYIHDFYPDVWKHAEKELEVPSAQPEIIRCKDCKWWEDDSYTPFQVIIRDDNHHHCISFDTYTKADDYCSFAGRRTDE